MVQERREPTINSIKPDHDEIARHQPRTSVKNGSAARVAPRQPPPKRFPAGLLALFVALIAGGIAVFSGWQLMQTQSALASAEKRIEGLEGQLKMATGESVESLGNVNEKLEWADSEIRKLWGVSYDTNRKGISANKDDIAALGKLVRGAADSVKQQKSAVSALQTSTNEQQLILAKLREDNGLQQSDLTRALTLIGEMQVSLKKLEADLPRKVAEHEEAIEAIDAFRRAVNADLLKIKQQLGHTP